jgi:CubicO group peptidase (beta-lactamase class C family)
MTPSPHRPRRIRRIAAVFTVLVALACLPAAVAAAARPPADAARAMDALLSSAFRPAEPGATVIVVRDGQTLLRKGYGMADLELGVRMEPDMRLRLGSVTKQFTAVAVLMLAEEGKLALDDPITRFLPGYPTHGHTITLEHLLTHTSGIRSYTDMPEWLPLWRKDMPLDTLIALFRDQPMDFAPGEKWAYDNSGYVLLGAVIEKASGRAYADFVRDRIFAPLGMTSSSYDTTESVVPRRVPGYQKGDGGWTHAPYLSMTQPHAAGSLMSTVDDLARWDAALYTEKLVKQASLRRAWTPATLADGKSTGYGYGWTMSAVQGHPSVEHGGGINGFVCHALRLPEDRVYVAVLTNRVADAPVPDRLAVQLAAIAVGRPYEEPKPVALTTAQLDALTGVYRIGEKEQRVITREGTKLFSQRSGGAKRELLALSPTGFYLKDSFTRFEFRKDAAGQATAVAASARYGPPEVATRTDQPLPAERQAVKIDPAVYDRYVGRYQLAPGFDLAVRREGERLMTRATGQAEVEIFPESETRFFLKVVDAQIDFLQDTDGRVTGLVLHQGGQDLQAQRVE